VGVLNAGSLPAALVSEPISEQKISPQLGADTIRSGARAMLLAESDPYIADSLGWALFQLGDLERAKGLIESARDELLPRSHWEIEEHLGDIYWHEDRKDEARTAWTTALENYPPNADKDRIAAKLKEGLTTPRPEKRPLPAISLEDLEVERQDI
jgi:tetratricopeptide (TPR) repeat protein